VFQPRCRRLFVTCAFVKHPNLTTGFYDKQKYIGLKMKWGCALLLCAYVPYCWVPCIDTIPVTCISYSSCAATMNRIDTCPFQGQTFSLDLVQFWIRTGFDCIWSTVSSFLARRFVLPGVHLHSLRQRWLYDWLSYFSSYTTRHDITALFAVSDVSGYLVYTPNSAIRNNELSDNAKAENLSCGMHIGLVR